MMNRIRPSRAKLARNGRVKEKAAGCDFSPSVQSGKMYGFAAARFAPAAADALRLIHSIRFATFS
jgi:hypothetical protein